MNVYSEIFVFKGEENEESAATKPWLSEPLPELQAVSSKDLCLEKSGSCVILVLDVAPTPDQIQLMKDVNSKFVSNLEDRGPQFSFMWVNNQVESAFTSAFGISKVPSVIVLRAATSKYLTFTDEISQQALTKVLEKIVSGEGKFTKLKSDIPKFSKRA